jgi:hypothetical protein
MSAYNPPIDNLPIFDTLVFREASNDTLTRTEADNRYLRTPISLLAFKFEPSSTQQFIPDNTTTTIIFPVAEVGNTIGTGLDYNNLTGVFTNNSSYALRLQVTANIVFPFNTVGYRILNIQKNTGRVGYTAVGVSPLGQTGYVAASNFICQPAETFDIRVFQNSGTVGGLPLDTTGIFFPNRVSVLIFNN